jgi:hypothetical protein
MKNLQYIDRDGDVIDINIDDGEIILTINDEATVWLSPNQSIELLQQLILELKPSN